MMTRLVTNLTLAGALLWGVNTFGDQAKAAFDALDRYRAAQAVAVAEFQQATGLREWGR